MPALEFFNKLGVFTQKEFLKPEECSRIRAEMRLSRMSAAKVVDETGHGQVKETRRTHSSWVSAETTTLVTEKLNHLKPGLEQHFSVEIGLCEEPQFLVYKVGDYFLAHQDRGEEPNKPGYVRQRQLTVVVFLNSEKTTEANDYYSGGSLSLYGLMNDPKWSNYGFKITAEPGTLVAFRADFFHEVTTVTAGERYSIVSWF